MLLSFAKRLAVGYLEASDDPQLRQAGAWINDAEKEAVDAVLRLIGASLRTDGKLTATTADQIRRVQGTANTDKPATESSASRTSPHLYAYIEILRTIVAMAGGRKAICLQGFLHDPACSSLWLFEGEGVPALSLSKDIDGQDQIEYSRSDLQVMIGKQLSNEDCRTMNARIGENYTSWRESLDESHWDKLLGVHEDRLMLHRAITREIKRRHGVDRYTTREFESRQFTDRVAGVDAMLASLPAALEARDASLVALAKRLR